MKYLTHLRLYNKINPESDDNTQSIILSSHSQFDVHFLLNLLLQLVHTYESAIILQSHTIWEINFPRHKVKQPENETRKKITPKKGHTPKNKSTKTVEQYTQHTRLEHNLPQNKRFFPST